MVDRARLARMPAPENGLKCPRCDSTSTKFCYYNNYSLTQPRHFCKTCRRYWTRGGALRNVPVGGGCRRNKRSKNGGKSGGGTAVSEKQSGGSGGSGNTSADACPTSCGSAEITGNFSQPSSQLPLMAAFQAGLNHYGGGTTNIGGFQPPQLVATNENGGFGEMSFQLGAEPWRLPASLTGFDTPSTNLFPFQNEAIEASSSRAASAFPQLTSSVKMEDTQGLNSNSTKQFLGALGNTQFWGGAGGNTWTGGFSGHLNSSSTSSSTGHLLWLYSINHSASSKP